MKLSKKQQWLAILLIIGFMSITVRVLINYDFHNSSLLYIGIPFFISILLTFVYPEEAPQNWKRRYLKITISALIIFLGSSILLFEGFLCVLLFMPIYFAILLFMFISKAIAIKFKYSENDNQLLSMALPTLLLITAFEGTHPNFSFSRENSIVVSKTINGNIESVKRKLQQPINIDKERGWLLKLFPMPYNIEAESLSEGDIHKIDFKYHRWFFTNTHEGSMKLKIAKVTDTSIKTEFVQDTSYIANYLRLKGTEIRLNPINANQLKVTLIIDYERTLDPAWYFEPLQKQAITQTAELLIKEVISPN